MHVKRGKRSCALRLQYSLSGLCILVHSLWETRKERYKCACQQKNADWARSRQKLIINSVTLRCCARQHLFFFYLFQSLSLCPLPLGGFSLFSSFRLHSLSNLFIYDRFNRRSEFFPQETFALHENKRENLLFFF